MTSGEDTFQTINGGRKIAAVRDLSVIFTVEGYGKNVVGGHSDTERGPVTFNPIELDGFAATLSVIAD